MNNKPAVVRVNVFSGRRNPEWTMDIKDIKKFLHLWDLAEPIIEIIKPISKLGYSGCTVIIDNNRWEIYNGFATFYSPDSTISKKDNGNSIERSLLKDAPEEIMRLVKFR